MASLKSLLAAKIESSGLKVTAAAKKAGISFPSFHAALIGKATPNARSVDKYAKFLGISAEEVMSAAGKKAAPIKAAKKGKPGRRGRPPGSKNKTSNAATSTRSASAPKGLPKIAKALAKAAATLEKLAAVLSAAG